MNTSKQQATAPVKCSQCPLMEFKHFRSFNAEELKFMPEFKTGELTVDKSATVIVEGANSAHLYTVLQGWAFRYKILEDGRRQILNYLLPGDLVGLQGSLMGEMQHSVEALTGVTLCVFERDRLPELFRDHPNLSYDITWIAAREERILDEHLLSIGRRSALERAAYLLAFLYKRAHAVGMSKKDAVTIPITQQHMADTLGLSIVHTNKTLKKITARCDVKWLDRGCEIRGIDTLISISGWNGEIAQNRPYI